MIQTSISFFFQTPYALKERTKLKSFITGIFRKEKVSFKHMNYIFCSDDQLLTINRQFLQHDFLTDVITFPLSSKGEPVEAEVYLSIDRIRDNAKTLSQPIVRELHRVMFHGALHLCGYKDKTSTQIKEIRAREDYYLDKFSKL